MTAGALRAFYRMTEPLGAEYVDQEIDSHDVRFHAEAFERIERFDRYHTLAQNSARVEIRNDAMDNDCQIGASVSQLPESRRAATR